MFHSARLKLTAYYLLIIMTISFLFSAFIYHQLTGEFERILKIEKERLERQINQETLITPDGIQRRVVYINPEVIEESKKRILWMLIVVNAGILTLSAAAGYFLAGRTLKPIKEMIDQQDQFITDASHELKTPLTALKTQIEVALRDKKLSIKESKDMLQSNLEEVNSLQHLSESLMKLSQNSQQITPYHQPISLREEINTAIKKMSPLARNKKITVELTGRDYFIKGEPGNITDLITILLDNAIKYSNPKTKVQIKTRSTDGHVVIEVIDQGIGIDQKDLPHLFDRFYRSDRSRTKKDSDGFGLGLSIAKKIVTNLNGKIEAKSPAQSGSTFVLTLPRLKV
jgi:two-component system sensor histidine kinase CiaH